jgi:dTMP kinase
MMGKLAGRFIAFDGPDGSGKSTQINRFVKKARAGGLIVREVREPGGRGDDARLRDASIHGKSLAIS